MRAPLSLALVAALAAGCGSASPTAPTDPATGGLAFQAGQYRLSIIGLGCGSKELEAALPSVFLAVTLQPDGAAWVVAPAHANGTLRLRFEKGPGLPNLPAAIVLSGSVSGAADDEGSAGAPAADALRVTIPAAPLSGTMLSPESASGTIEGPVVFTRSGGSLACIPGAVNWTFSRPSPKIAS
jgi:hypothetical protein